MTTTTRDRLAQSVSPLCLGGNVFGWTMTEAESFAVLDAYVAAGGNFLDTADSYSVWVDDHSGGESETIIGEWMHARRNRDELIVATKGGQLHGVRGGAIRRAIEDSLRRLQTDHVDLYYAHIDDETVPLEETLGMLNELVTEGKVRWLGASGYTAARLERALAISDREEWARYVVLQPLYNLLERDAYEGELESLCAREDVACVPFFGLARGFLTGKYRPGTETDSKRGGFAWTGEWDQRTCGLLDVLDDVAATHGTTVAAVALAWLAAQPTVLCPIASARTETQLAELLPMSELQLTDEDIRRLTEAGKR